MDDNAPDSPRVQSLARGRKVAGYAEQSSKRRDFGDGCVSRPILQALDQLGGHASSRQVLEIVETLMGDSLKGKDLEKQDSGEIRWRYRAQMSRLVMVKEGLLDSTAAHGTGN